MANSCGWYATFLGIGTCTPLTGPACASCDQRHRPDATLAELEARREEYAARGACALTRLSRLPPSGVIEEVCETVLPSWGRRATPLRATGEAT